MHRSVLERWIDSLSERQFDAPFLKLLRAYGFYDIHFTHGAYEFGKDFIAKRIDRGEETQYAFQCKAGNISASAWDGMYRQLVQLTRRKHAAAGFDTSLPLEVRLVTTGRLVGLASVSAKDLESEAREAHFAVWDRENLLDMLGASPQAPLAVPLHAAERLLAQLTTDELTMPSLLELLDASEWRVGSLRALRERLLQLSLLENELRLNGRCLHAIRVAQQEVRLALDMVLTGDDAEARTELSDAIDRCVAQGLTLARLFSGRASNELLAQIGNGIGIWAAYPATCAAVCEGFAFAILRALEKGEKEAAFSLAEECAGFIEANPGCLHPLSDRFAPGLLTTVAALSLGKQAAAAEALVRGATKWVCDAIEDGWGLAGPLAEVQEEVERVFGAAFDFIEYTPRKESLLGVALCDVAYVFLPELYPVVFNEFAAVDAVLTVTHPMDCRDSMFRGAGAIQRFINLEYPANASSALLPHHEVQSSARSIEALGGALAPLLVGCLCGDRLYTDCLPRLASKLK